MFVGDPALQVGPELASLPGVLKVTDKASALQALDVIVEQGEGSPTDFGALALSALHRHPRQL